MTSENSTNPRSTREAVDELNASDHEWYRTHFTGNIVCAKCHLLPLDGDDFDTECEPGEDGR
jgi:hypothetical protein